MDEKLAETYLIGETTSILSPAGRGLLRAIEADRRKKRKLARQALTQEQPNVGE